MNCTRAPTTHRHRLRYCLVWRHTQGCLQKHLHWTTDCPGWLSCWTCINKRTNSPVNKTTWTVVFSRGPQSIRHHHHHHYHRHCKTNVTNGNPMSMTCTKHTEKWYHKAKKTGSTVRYGVTFNAFVNTMRSTTNSKTSKHSYRTTNH